MLQMEIMSESDSDRLSVNRFFSFPSTVFLNPMKFSQIQWKFLQIHPNFLIIEETIRVIMGAYNASSANSEKFKKQTQI